MKNFKIAIIIDHPDRDLDGLILLSTFLIKKNFEVVLVPMYYHSFEIPFINPDIILFNNIGDHNIEFIKRYKSKGISIAILNSEEGIHSSKLSADHPLKMAKLFKKKNYFKYVDLYFCWGSYVANFMRKYSGLLNKQVIVSGCPRYDLCSPNFKNKFFTKEIEFDFLINTNFQASNPLHKNVNLEKKKFLIYGMEKKYIIKLFKSYDSTFVNYLNLIDTLVNLFKTKKFLLRAHPFENEDIYFSKFKKYQNVTIDRKGVIFKSIIKSNLVMHLNCGSSIDALFLKKIPISFEFLNNNILKENSPLPSKISLRAKNLKHLCKILKNPNRIKFDFDKARKKISNWFKINNEYKYSSQELTACIQKFLLGKKNHSTNSSIFLLLKAGQSDYFIKNFVYRFFYFFVGPIFLKTIENLRPSTKIKNFNVNSVILSLKKLIDKKYFNMIGIKHCKHHVSKLNLKSVNILLKKKIYI
jgi:surface carbohydrate biosynthesis protein